MRIKLYNCLFWIMLAFACILFSCAGADMEEKSISKAKREMDSTIVYNGSEETFEADTLSMEQLNVFQVMAQQKLQDLIDYIEIISNKKYDSLLRLEAKKQIEELFVDTNVKVDISFGQVTKGPLLVSEFLSEVYQSEYDSIKLQVDSIVTQELQKSNETMKYTGSILSKVNITGYKNGQSFYNSASDREAQIIVSKTEKMFGEEKRSIWSVKIGELK